MKYTFVILAVVAFALAIWVSQSIASDIQLILLLVATVAGFMFLGFAAVLHELGRRSL